MSVCLLVELGRSYLLLPLSYGSGPGCKGIPEKHGPRSRVYEQESLKKPV